MGYGEGGVLTEAVRQRPYSVVLLDECEKADLEVMNLFYQVFDKGVLNDGEGRAVDFRNTVIILTSNLALGRAHADCTKAAQTPTAEEVVARDPPRPQQALQAGAAGAHDRSSPTPPWGPASCGRSSG